MTSGDKIAQVAELEALLLALGEPRAVDTMNDRVAQCDRALGLFAQTGVADPVRQACVELELAGCLIGTRESRPRALAALNRGLGHVTPQLGRDVWFALMLQLAEAQLATEGTALTQRVEIALPTYEKVATTASPNDEPEIWAKAQANLGYCYLHRTSGDPANNLWRADLSLQAALHVYDVVNHRTERAGTLNNLGSTLRKALKGRPSENIERSIDVYEQALKLWNQATEPREWAQTASNLGNAYADRIVGERAENLDQAIIAFQHAIPVFAAQRDPVPWSIAMTLLAATTIDRIRGDRAVNIEDAIGDLDKALDVLDPASALRALPLFHRARAFVLRARGDRWDNIEQAIVAFEAVRDMSTQTIAPAFRAAVLAGLADAYEVRVLGARQENIVAATSAINGALAIFTRDVYPLFWARATAQRARLLLCAVTGLADDPGVTEALQLYDAALEACIDLGVPADILTTAQAFADGLFERDRFAESVAPYRHALNAAEQLYASSLSQTGKIAELTAGSGLAGRAAYALAHSGDLAFACVVLERNRARWINDVLDRDRAPSDGLRAANTAVFARYDAAVARVNAIEAAQASLLLSQSNGLGTDRRWLQEARDAQGAVQQARSEITKIPGADSLFGFVTFEQIGTAIRPDQPLIYLAVTSHGGMALLLRRSQSGETEATMLELDQLTTTLVTTLANGAPNSTDSGWIGALANAPRAGPAWFSSILDVSGRLWEPLVEPLLTALSQCGAVRACIVPSGALAFFPLHAAWTRVNGALIYAVDHAVLTLTASARALARSEQIAMHTVKTALVVADPRPVSAPALENAVIEATGVASTFVDSTIVRSEEATRPRVLASLRNVDVAHFACHGASDVMNPMRSGILLAGDDLLSVADLFALALTHMRLVTLSACETAMVGETLPDESVSLAEAFVRAGCAGVVGSLWKIPDRATAMLMTRFYERLIFNARDGRFDPPLALNDAQRWLRDTTNAQKQIYFASFVPAISNDPSCIGRLDPDVAQSFHRALQADDPNECSYAHPFYWAAFAYTGV